MAHGHSEEFKRDAVRIALTSGLARRQASTDLGVSMSTLNKWIKTYRDTDVVSKEDQELLRENERLRRGKVMRLYFVHQYRGSLSQGHLCKLLNVTSRGYRSWRGLPANRRQRDDMVLLVHIREQHRLCLNSYGRPRMTEELKELGLDVGHRRVGRLMRQNSISVVRARKHKVTTDRAAPS